MSRGHGPTKIRDEAYSIAFAKLVKTIAEALRGRKRDRAVDAETPCFKRFCAIEGRSKTSATERVSGGAPSLSSIA